MQNETKFTPGPWFTKREGWSTVYVEARIDGGMIQEVAACGPTDAGQDQQQANAHLIAAAPELYEALDALIKLYEEDDGCRELPEYISARTALSKARGEA